MTFNLLVEGSNPSRPTIATEGFRSDPEPFFFSAIRYFFRKVLPEWLLAACLVCAALREFAD